MHILCGKAPSAGFATQIIAGLFVLKFQVVPLSREIKVKAVFILILDEAESTSLNSI